ncbi:MAG: hypothetical protein KGL39_16970 [Patescibacteria group bacterium]|nr:hypothetical protein [Patescibacteria group bacterium]
MRWLVGLILAGTLIAQVPAPGPQGGGVSGGSGGNSILLQGTAQAGASGFSINLPSSNGFCLGPCAGGGLTGTVPIAYAEAQQGYTVGNTQSGWWTWDLGSSYTGTAISYVVEFRGSDSTHAVVVTPSWACASTGALDNPTFTSLSTFNLTASAASGRTLSSTQTFTPTCSAGNRVWLQMSFNVAGLSTSATFDLVSVKLTGAGII